MDNENVYTITATVNFRPYRVPARCRKARRVDETFTHEITVPSVTCSEAPLAATVPTYDADVEIPLRVHDGQLLRPNTGSRNPAGVPIGAGSDDFPAEVSISDSWSSTEYDAVAELENRFKGIVIVDGGVWVPADEPAYVIQHFGMGRNHGGTSLDIVISGAGHFSPRSRFSILEHDVAVEHAIAAAERVGDDRSIERIRRTRPATVHIPAAFQMPTREARLTKAEADLNALLDAAAGFQTGASITREDLSSAAEWLQKARHHMYEHGLDSVERHQCSER